MMKVKAALAPRKMLKIWCVYVFLGPVIGAAVGWVELFAWSWFDDLPPGLAQQITSLGVIFLRIGVALAAVPLGFLFGLYWGLPLSLLTATSIVVLGRRNSGSLIDALSVAATVYVTLFGAVYVYAWLVWKKNDLTAFNLSLFDPLFLISCPQFACLPVLIATGVCWFIVNSVQSRT